MELFIKMVIGLLFILFLSYSAWKMKSLSTSGMVGAFLVGSAIFIGFSWEGLILLGCFFVSSSVLGKVKAKRKVDLGDILVKGDQRDIIQVMANGGIPAVVAIIYFFTKDVNSTIFIILFTVSLAAATSDTWASEVGTLSRSKPRMLLTLRKVETGTSGAVSVLGTFAGIAGALFFSAIASITFPLSIKMVVYITIFGFLGNIFDTLLGQTVQIKYKCVVCHKLTEKRMHCQTYGAKTKGYLFLNNDSVNFLSILFTTGLAFLFVWLC